MMGFIRATCPRCHRPSANADDIARCSSDPGQRPPNTTQLTADEADRLCWGEGALVCASVEARTTIASLRGALDELEAVLTTDRPLIATMRDLSGRIGSRGATLAASLRPDGAIYEAVALLNERDAEAIRRPSAGSSTTTGRRTKTCQGGPSTKLCSWGRSPRRRSSPRSPTTSTPT